MVTRRDEIFHAFDSALHSLRTNLSGAPPSGGAPSSNQQPQIQRNPTAASSSSITSASSNIVNGINRFITDLNAGGSGFSTTSDGRQVYAQPGASSSSRTNGGSAILAGGSVGGRGQGGGGGLARPVSPSEDTLPAYSKRPPDRPPDSLPGPSTSAGGGAGGVRSRLPLHPHTFSNRSGKLELEVLAPGRGQWPVVVQGIHDYVTGNLTLRLEKEEAVSAIRIRVKGVVRTVALRVNGNGRHPVLDEIVFHQDLQTLWSHETSPLLQDEKLRPGVYSYPFTFQLPREVNFNATANPGSIAVMGGPRRAGGGTVRMELPPSFALVSEAAVGLSRTTEWASVKYYIKVTLAKRGLLRPNERMFAPLIYLTRHPITKPPTPIISRALTLSSGHALPGPSHDPRGWSGKRVRVDMRKGGGGFGGGMGLFGRRGGGGGGGGEAWYESIVLVPSPAVFPQGCSIPYFIKITSSDPNVTSQFPPQSSISVHLMQHIHLTAQGVPGLHENIVASGRTYPDPDCVSRLGDGANEVRKGEDGWNEGGRWCKRLKGEIKTRTAMAATFSCPNVSVQYSIEMTIHPTTTNSQGYDTHISLPCTIISLPPPGSAEASEILSGDLGSGGAGVGGAAAGGVGAVGGEGGAMGGREEDDSTTMPELPPSYFQVMEEGR